MRKTKNSKVVPGASSSGTNEAWQKEGSGKHDPRDDWHRLDAMQEEKFVSSTNETSRLEALLRQRQGASGDKREAARASWQASITKEEPGPEYKGPRLKFPLGEEDVYSLYHHVKTKPDVPLHPGYMANMLFNAQKLYQQLPRVTEITHSDGKHDKFVVVGDIHGQLADLLYIVEKQGFPGPGRTMYLFNGDFVDRGKYGVEVMTLLVAFKLAFPDSIHMNRGNHEDDQINMKYGFLDEVQRKFGRGHMYQEFQELWNCLPVATIIDGLAIVLHGGLFRQDGVTLSHLKALPRVPCNLQPKNFQETLMVDLLWSDPSDTVGHDRGVRGGNTVNFGPDVTHKFLALNNLKMLIRSHEVPPSNKGYEVRHNGRCVTVFSASNYCGHRGNSGAVMVFQPDLKYSFQEYWAPALDTFLKDTVPKCPPKRPASGESEGARQDVIRQVKMLVLEHKQDLQWFFTSEDEMTKGFITIEAWRRGMNAILKLDLPWEKYEGAMLSNCLDSAGHVLYNKFLSQFRVEVKPEYSQWKNQVVKRVHDALLAADLNLTEMVNVFDHNNDGVVDVDELSKVFGRLKIPVTREQVEELLQDVVVSGKVNVIALIESLQVKRDPRAPDVQEALDRLGNLFAGGKRFKDTVQMFENFDENGDGKIQHKEFMAVVKKLVAEDQKNNPGNSLEISDEMIKKIIHVIDANNSGSIDYLEFVDVFHKQRSGMDRLLEQICRVFYKYQDSLGRVFHYMDIDGDGVLTPDEFKEGLSTFNAMVSEPLTDHVIQSVVQHIDRNKDGQISYQEFCAAFYFVDESGPSVITDDFKKEHAEHFKSEAPAEVAIYRSNSEGIRQGYSGMKKETTTGFRKVSSG